jgi:hypothetical protein
MAGRLHYRERFSQARYQTCKVPLTTRYRNLGSVGEGDSLPNNYSYGLRRIDWTLVPAGYAST